MGDIEWEKLINRNDTPLDRNDPMTDEITKPFKYLQNLPGNNRKIRMIFIKAFNELYFHINNDKLIEELNEIIDMLHDSSLLIDDIEDSSEYRRGAPTAHLKFGVPITINCANLIYFIAIHKSNNLSPLFTDDTLQQQQISLNLNKIIVEEMLNLHHGQGIEIYWRNTKSEKFPTELEYLEMAMDKTGGLLRIMGKLLNCFKPCISTNYIKLTNLIGIIYQLRDDYLNLVSDKYSHMKGIVGEDLIEGKFSFPILHSLSYSIKSPVYDLLYNYDLNQRKESSDLRLKAIDYMKNESKSLEYTKTIIESKLKEAKTLIETDKHLKDLNFDYINKIFEQLIIT